MKIWHQKVGEGKFDLDLVNNYNYGDIEIFDDGDVFVVLESGSCSVFNNDYTFEQSSVRNDLVYECVTSNVKVIKRTKIAEKVHKNNIWKETEEWLVVKI